jgi:hypothetical protein
MDEHPQNIARIVEFSEGEAYADFYQAAPADFAARYGLQVERVGSAIVLIAQELGEVLFNRRAASHAAR